MIFFLIILLLIAVRSATIAAQDQFNKNYLSKIDANNIKGIFVILIIFSHYVGYVQLGGAVPCFKRTLKSDGCCNVLVLFRIWNHDIHAEEK